MWVYLFWGFLEITRQIATMTNKNKNRKNMVALFMLSIPQTMSKSNVIMRRYRMPTIFMTNIPDSSVAGPVSTQGKMAGHKYVAACENNLKSGKW